MASSESSSTRPPQVEPLRLPVLSEGPADDLVAGADLQAAHLTYGEGGSLNLRGARLWGCHLDQVTADEADLAGSRLAEVRLDVGRIPVLEASRTDWHDVEVTGRLGSVEAYEARWRSLRLRDVTVDYLNLRGADLRGVTLSSDQLTLLAPVLAAELGIRVEV